MFRNTKAVQRNLVMLTVTLAMTTPALAVTGDDLIKGAADAVKGGKFTWQDIFNPGAAIDRAIGLAANSVPNTVIQAGLKDVLWSMKGTDDAIQQSGIFESVSNAAGLFQEVGRTNTAVKSAFDDPFNLTKIKAAGSGLDQLFSFMDQKTQADIASQPKYSSVGSNIGEKVGAKIVIQNQKVEETANVATGLNVSQTQKLATIATDEAAQKLNIAADARVDNARQTLEQDTADAVSTRAVSQAMNMAFASYMEQEQFGNRQIQTRLNLMLQQAALSNAQLGDIVHELRAETEKADAAKLSAIKRQQKAGLDLIRHVREQTASVSNILDGAAKDGGAGAMTIPTPTIPGSAPIDVPYPVSPVVPGNVPQSGASVPITVPQPKSGVVPQPVRTLDDTGTGIATGTGITTGTGARVPGPDPTDLSKTF